jgi:hypothetical protein
MAEKLEDLLTAKETELLYLRSSMQNIKLQFINVTSDFAAKWFEETARQYVIKYSNVCLSLSTQSFGDLKAKVRKLVVESKQISEKVFSQPGIWRHDKPELHAAVSQYDQLGNQQVGNKYPEIIDSPVRIALGELGIVLEEFGFNIRTTVTHGSQNQEYWFQKTEEKINTPYFPLMLEWSKSMQDTVQEYNVLYKQALSKMQEIQRIKDEIKRRKIIELWDGAP